MLPGLPPARRRLRAARHQLRRRRRSIAAVLLACAALAALRTLAPPPPKTVEVLVAARDLPSGTLLAGDDLARRAFPVALVPSGASGAATGRVLAAPLSRGEVLTDSRVVGPGLTGAEPGDTVLPVRLPDAGMAALLHPGDVVDLTATDPGSGTTRVVARDVRVLSGAADVPDGPTGSDGALVVLSATYEDAMQIASAALTQYLTPSWSS